MRKIFPSGYFGKNYHECKLYFPASIQIKFRRNQRDEKNFSVRIFWEELS